MDVRQAVDASVRRQDGVIARSQALELGLTDNQIQAFCTTGTWVRLSSGVYSPASTPPSWKRQLRAATLAHPWAVVGGRSAAVLHGFRDINASRPELLAPFSANARSSLARIIRSRHFDVVATTNRQGFEMTTPAETILTLSLRLPTRQIERIIDGVLAGGHLVVEAFDPIFDRLAFARQPGLKPLRRIVGTRRSDSYQPPTSVLEGLLYPLLDRPEVPEYERQFPISYTRLNATVDAYIPDWKLIVEADGRRWHTSKEHFEVDRERDNQALARGLAVIRFSWKKLRYEPESALSTLIATGRHRARP